MSASVLVPVMMALRWLTGACGVQDEKMADLAKAAAHWDAAYAQGRMASAFKSRTIL